MTGLRGWWSVSCEMAAPAGSRSRGQMADEITRLAGLLQPHSGVVSGTGDRYVVRLSVEADAVDQAIRRGRQLIRKLAAAAALPEWPAVRAEAATRQVCETEPPSDLAWPQLPRLAGVTEVARLLRVSPQRVIQLRQKPDFPLPFAKLASGQIWLEPAICRFLQQWDRQRGRSGAGP